ncbi:MAG: UDP-N-acetylglucosamine 2-epimerase [Peptostreptococcales bacterium]
MIKVCVITATRAEFGLLSNLIKKLYSDKDCVLQLIVTGSHLSEEFGLTYKEIELEGIPINLKIPILAGSSESRLLQTMSNAIIKIGEAIHQLQPDVVVLLGDRYEIHAIASACVILKVPIAHISGGEISEGAFDEYFRHSITKLSYLHFTSTEEYRDRVIQMGEHPDRVYNVGDLGIENINTLKFMNKNEIEKDLGIKLWGKVLQVTFHPVTLEQNSVRDMEELFLALEERPQYQVIITRPNADTGFNEFNDVIDTYVKRNNLRFFVFESLGYRRFLSLLKHCVAIIGNSSSGIVEAPAIGIGSINIGSRQQGRISAASVLHIPPSKQSILKAIDYIETAEYQNVLLKIVSPYQSNGTSSKIVDTLKHVVPKFLNRHKSFYQITNGVANE